MAEAPTPKKIHVITQAYLRGWTNDEGKLGVKRPGTVGFTPASPESVGYRKRWWSKTNPRLLAHMEDYAGRIETEIPGVLSDPSGCWPYSDDQRTLLGQFMALHVLRSPAWRAWHDAFNEDQLGSYETGWSSATPFEDFAGHVRSDEARADSIKRLLPKVASVLASTHWSLIVFDEPLLITSDHPVVLVPLALPGDVAPYDPAPSGGIVSTIEYRFALGPRHLLICCWADRFESKPIAGTWDEAMSFNESARGQSEHEWYSRLRGSLPLSPAILRHRLLSLPLSAKTVPGYDLQKALASRRRRLVLDEINRRIEADDDRPRVMMLKPEYGPPRRRRRP